jgi:hypothetical protein
MNRTSPHATPQRGEAFDWNAHVSYHVATLGEAGALEVVRKREVRGATEKFYFFS